MQLIFEDRKFILNNVDPSKVFHVLNVKLWDMKSDSTFSTKNINEAVKFRQYANNKVKFIFKELMLKSVPSPLDGFNFPLVPDGETLMPFQKDEGVPFILSQNKSYLAHEPGLGKTPQFISMKHRLTTLATLSA